MSCVTDQSRDGTASGWVVTRADDRIREQLELVSDRFDFLDALDGANGRRTSPRTSGGAR
ncbi:hypothetical protein [Haloferax chudinovii]|uniref:Uncharacterized protein n=1 Tax=Haloferax chudinovii TaxID=1109010 RepID=A0ABD5XNX3_9EURY